MTDSGRNDGRTNTSEAAALAHVERRLVAEYGASLPEAMVHDTILDVAAEWADAKVRSYVPVFIERAVRRRLAAVETELNPI